MNWNDYEAAWKRQPLPAGAEADLAGLRGTFEAKRRRLAATLKMRDYLESAAGLLVAGAFGWTAWHMGVDGWPAWLAALLMAGLSGLFLRERLRAHRLRLGPDASVLAKIEADLAELRHQHRLLVNVGSWYLLPCAGAIVLFGFATIRKGLRELPPDFLPKLWEHPWLVAGVAGYFVIVLPLLFWGIWAMNRRVVRLNIEPRMAELEKLRGDVAQAD
jgi:hypothetical protein